MKFARFLTLTLLYAGVYFHFADAQPVNKSPLSIETIMQRTEFWRGSEPEDLLWSSDNQTLYFEWNPERDTLPGTYRISLKDHQPVRLSEEEKRTLPGRNKVYSSDFEKMAYIQEGKIFLHETRKDKTSQLTDFTGNIAVPVFSADGKKLTFLYNQNLFSIDLSNHLVSQITDFISAEERKDPKSTGQAKWLEEQQLELFDVLKERELTRQENERQNKERELQRVARIYLGKDRLASLSLSPTERYIAFTTFRQASGKETAVTHFVTRSGYTEERQGRTKVGSPQPLVALSLLDRNTQKVTEVKTSGLSGIRDLPDYLDDYPHKKPQDDKISDRIVNLSAPIWNRTSDEAIVIARAHDNKDRWICLLDAETATLQVLDRQRDEAWIGGPGTGGFSGSAGWLNDNETVWFQSEESGYSHIYTLNIRTGIKKALTEGKWEVYDPQLSRDGRSFWFTANMKHPGIRHFYQIPVNGGSPVQITRFEGGNEITMSPDEKWLAIRHSTGNQPWELYLQENKPGTAASKITRSSTPEFESYPWRMPEYVTFTAEDGETVHARLYKPENPSENRPAVIFVHGAGYLQNAHQWWSSYYREYMFHNILADNGYTVLDIDYRGSAGYGRDWRTGIYRHMGGKDLSDHVDGARYLIDKHNVTPGKIGIYGGSYGGFITLMAMFKHPDLFAAGAALRSVTDWAHYNHGYTSNILNTPVEDSLAYVRSSPIYFADGLAGALLMCHGMVDDNVQFQDIVRITQRLIELGKENWELAVYPVESHGFTEPSSWVDEYKRIFKLFEENLK
jgi:dipeptidyl aminopeptidase/acylaminoacyl peptidase